MAGDKKNALDISFEKLSLGHKDEYADFLIAAYQDQFNYYRFAKREAVQKRWVWEYSENPNLTKEKPLIWICRIKGRIIGQFCLMPVEIKVGNKLYKGGWGQDFIVLPQYRGKGLGYLLVKHVIKEAKTYLDILLIAGTSKISYTLFKRLGFIDIGFIGRNIKAIDFQNISNKLTDKMVFQVFFRVIMKLLFKYSTVFRPVSQGGGIRIVEADGFDETFNDFWLDISKKFPNIIKRDKETLNWRFINQPCWKYKIFVARTDTTLKGYAVLREGEVARGKFNGLRVGIISDILFDPQEKNIGMSLCNAAFKYFGEKTDILRCDLLSRDMKRFIKSKGFIGIKSNNKFLIYPLMEELKMDENHAILTDRNKWHLTYSDSDLDLS